MTKLSTPPCKKLNN